MNKNDINSRLPYEIVALAIKDYKDLLQGQLYFKEIKKKAGKFIPPIKEPKNRHQKYINAGAKRRWVVDIANNLAREYAQNEGIKVTPVLIEKILSDSYFNELKNSMLSIDGWTTRKLDKFFCSEWNETLLYACDFKMDGYDIIKVLREKCGVPIKFKDETEKQRYISRLNYLEASRLASRAKREAAIKKKHEEKLAAEKNDD